MLEWLTHSKSVLGMNERNLKYLRPYNKKTARKIADDKLLMKRVAKLAEIQSPEVFAVIRNRAELNTFNWNKLPNSFVVKPRKGFGGAGILVVFGRNKKTGNWVKADRSQVSAEMLQTHIANILDGTYSLKNSQDYAIIEERVKLHPVFKPYAFRGIPDVRIICFNKVPIMAELRLPTKASGGTANLHTGGVGVGIDMGTGITTNAIQYNQLITSHPDTNMPLSGIRIPFWKTMLEMTVRAQLVSKLGYLAIDIALDRDKGPMVFEFNARPGLAIQIANLEGLKGRLRRVKGLKVKTVEQGVRLARDLFGGEVEEEIEEISGRQVIGVFEYATFYGKNGKKAKVVKTKVDTGAYLTSIDKELAYDMGYKDAYEHFLSLGLPKRFEDYNEAKEALKKMMRKAQKHADVLGLSLSKSAVGGSFEIRPVLNISFLVSGVKLTVRGTIASRNGLIYSAIIGRNDLGPFLVDPSKRLKKPV